LLWTVASGPAGGASLDAAGQLRPTAKLTQPGTYVFRLTVTKVFQSIHADVTVVVAVTA